MDTGVSGSVLAYLYRAVAAWRSHIVQESKLCSKEEQNRNPESSFTGILVQLLQGILKISVPVKEVNNSYVVFARPPATPLPPVEKSKQEVGLSLLVPVCAPADDHYFIKREKGNNLVRQESQHRFGPGEDVKTHITFVLAIWSD